MGNETVRATSTREFLSMVILGGWMSGSGRGEECESLQGKERGRGIGCEYWLCCDMRGKRKEEVDL